MWTILGILVETPVGLFYIISKYSIIWLNSSSPRTLIHIYIKIHSDELINALNSNLVRNCVSMEYRLEHIQKICRYNRTIGKIKRVCCFHFVIYRYVINNHDEAELRNRIFHISFFFFFWVEIFLVRMTMDNRKFIEGHLKNVNRQLIRSSVSNELIRMLYLTWLFSYLRYEMPARAWFSPTINSKLLWQGSWKRLTKGYQSLVMKMPLWNALPHTYRIFQMAQVTGFS